jgi:hypothetical protein
MALGFTVEGINRVSQLSYELYQIHTHTSDQDLAARNTGTLGSELFALYCALRHLHHIADDESSRRTIIDPNRHELQLSLDKLIADCEITLRSIETSSHECHVPVESTSLLNAPYHLSHNYGEAIAAAPGKSQLSLDKFGMNKTYRDKLQSHSDAINLVLNTFHW